MTSLWLDFVDIPAGRLLRGTASEEIDAVVRRHADYGLPRSDFAKEARATVVQQMHPESGRANSPRAHGLSASGGNPMVKLPLPANLHQHRIVVADHELVEKGIVERRVSEQFHNGIA